MNVYPEKEAFTPSYKDTIKRMDYLQILHFCSTMMDMALWQIRMNTNILPESERSEIIVERYKKKITLEIEPLISSRLQRGQYLCGDDFYAVDCILGHNVMWARSYGLFNSSSIKSYLSKNIKKTCFCYMAFSDYKDFDANVPRESSVSKNFSG